MAPRIGEKNVRGAATRDLLIQFAIAELQRVGPIDFSVDAVLRESGVSRGSLYHHFADRSALLAVAEGRFTQKRLKSINEQLRTQIDASTTGEEVFEALADVFQKSAKPFAQQDRRRRLLSIASTFNDEVLAEVLQKKEQEGNQYFVDTLRDAQSRGLIAPVVRIEGVAMTLQAMLLGRILVDQMKDKALQKATTDASLVALKALLNPQ